ncbi:MAG TPA: toxin co-regulated pilus biosynthesis Q family protein [Albitalea sp.]|uniref:toxin co-regulated pilus biosynthesis Q family protein n=1 Tax=Piscinibacter sp. TaxID=1903157 RepID=UPI002ED1422B
MRPLTRTSICMTGAWLLISLAHAADRGDEGYDADQVRSYGTGQGIELVRSSGRSLPLYKAVAAIVPRGYAFRTIGVDRSWLDQPVSWSAGREWIETLREAMSSYPELVLDISLGTKTVLLRQRHPQADSGAPRELTGYAVAKAEEDVLREHARPGRWDVKPSDKSLRATLSRWAESAGWQLAWEMTVDYPVTLGASLGGSFEEAVVAIVKSMEQAETPPKVIFYKGNRVVRIVAKGNE